MKSARYIKMTIVKYLENLLIYLSNHCYYWMIDFSGKKCQLTIVYIWKEYNSIRHLKTILPQKSSFPLKHTSIIYITQFHQSTDYSILLWSEKEEKKQHYIWHRREQNYQSKNVGRYNRAFIFRKWRRCSTDR